MRLHQDIDNSATHADKANNIQGDFTLAALIPVSEEESQIFPVGSTCTDIDLERDRRINAGVIFRSVLFQSRTEDRESIAESVQFAIVAIVNGVQLGDLRWMDAQADFFWIAGDNSRVLMDAHTFVEFGKTVLLHKQAHIIAGADLKKKEPIPLDYQDDKWWP